MAGLARMPRDRRSLRNGESPWHPPEGSILLFISPGRSHGADAATSSRHAHGFLAGPINVSNSVSTHAVLS